MQFNITTDYAIRTVVLLAAAQRKMTTEEISTAMAIPLNYLKKIINQLGKKNILDVHRGRYGGFILSKEAKDINLYDIVEAVEPNIKINRCLEEHCYCSRNAIKSCPVRKVYTDLQGKMEEILKNSTVADLVANIR